MEEKNFRMREKDVEVKVKLFFLSNPTKRLGYK